MAGAEQAELDLQPVHAVHEHVCGAAGGTRMLRQAARMRGGRSPVQLCLTRALPKAHLQQGAAGRTPCR